MLCGGGSLTLVILAARVRGRAGERRHETPDKGPELTQITANQEHENNDRPSSYGFQRTSLPVLHSN